MKKIIQKINKTSLRNALAVLLVVFTYSFSKSQCAANFSHTVGLNGSTAFTDLSIGTNTSTIYSWNFGEPLSGYNTSNAQNPNHMYGSNGVYSVTLTVVTGGTLGGCTSTIAQNVTVTTSPCNLPINANWTSTISVGSASFNSTSTGTTGAASYTWSFGDGGTAYTPNTTHNYTLSGGYYAKLLVVDGGCKDSLITYYNICTVQPSFTSVAGPNGSYSFSSTSTGTPGPITYAWYFGDGGNASGPVTSHTYNLNGNYLVTLWLNNMNFTTCPSPTAQVMISITNATCNLNASLSHTVNPGGVVNFESTTTGTIPGVSYAWNFGDGTTGSGLNTSHTYINGGNHNVWLKAINNIGCSDSVLAVVNVTTIPCVANSNFSLTYSGTPLLWYATPSYPWNITCATWSWGDGITYTTCNVYVSHTYSAAGIYTPCLNAQTACGTSSTCNGYSIFRTTSQVEMPAMITVSVVPLQQFITALKNNTEENAAINIYPNPNNGKLNVRIDNIRSAGSLVTIEIYDVLSKVVYSTRLNSAGGSVESELNLEHLSNGSYYVKIKTTDKNYLSKAIINK